MNGSWLIFPCLLLSVGSVAEEQTLTLDVQKTEVRFRLPATLHTVEGTLRLSAAEIRFNPATGLAAGAIRIDARSANTSNAWRDETMHAEVLESGKFPDIVFQSRRFSFSRPAAGLFHVTLFGELVIHGTKHELAISAEAVIDGRRVEIHAELTIPYVDWGMKDVSSFFLRVGKQVQVKVTTVGILDRPL